jgi:formylglycine-generating enzyme required for sulfatase activity
MDPARLLSKLTHARWLAADHDDRQVTIDALSERLPAAFAFVGFETHAGSPLALFEHAPTQARFVLILGGRFVMGFSDREQARLRELTKDSEDSQWIVDMLAGAWLGGASPTREVDVAPFLLAVEPLTAGQLARLIGREDIFIPPHRLGPGYGNYAREPLAALGLRLPSEAEWEYACRAGTTTLFPAGIDTLPQDPYLPPNGFGLALLGRFPELCADGYHPSYDGAPDDARPWAGRDPIVRGGAEQYWPWQGPGWSALLCGERSTLMGVDHICAIRPAASLFADELAYGEPAKQDRARAGLTQRPIPEPPVPEPEPSGPLVVRDMYDRVCGDLGELPELDMAGAKQLFKTIYATRFETTGRYYHDSTPRLVSQAIDLLLLDRAVPARHMLALLLADLITGGHQYAMPRCDWRAQGVASQDRSMLMLLAAHGPLLELLGDPDPRVRAAMAMLLAPAMQSSWTQDVFYECFLGEPELGAKASLAIAVGVAGTGVSMDVGRALAEQLTEHEHAPLVRIALAHALVSQMREHSEAAWLDVLGDAIGTQLPEGVWLPWYHGNLDELAEMALWGCGEPGKQTLARGYMRRLRELERLDDDEASRREATRHANVLLILSFELTEAQLDARSLTELQREVITCLSGERAPAADYRERGIPEDVEQRLAWLRSASMIEP